MSYNALELAANMAQRHDAKIILLNVYQSALIVTGGGSQVITKHETDENRINFEKLIQQQKNQINEKYPDVEIETTLKQGTFIEALNETVLTDSVDIIVMGTEGKQNFKKFVLGSHTYDTIANANCSVITVPKEHRKMEFSKILFPLRDVEGLFNKLNYSISLLEKNESFMNILGLTELERAPEFKKIISPILKPLLDYIDNFNVNIEFTDSNADSIVSFSKENNNDLIVISDTDEASWKTFIAGNFFKKIINGTNIPLLFVKPTPVIKNPEVSDTENYDLTLPVPGF